MKRLAMILGLAAMAAGSAGAGDWDLPVDKEKGVFAIQAAKGPGHGLITIDKKTRTATFQAYRLNFDATKPQNSDQFPGFPVTLELDD